MGDDDYDHFYKVVLVGDATVGKTHLLSRYVKSKLPKAPTATVGVEFATRIVKLSNGSKVKAQIWDTAGQERYRAITSTHYRRAVGALLCYDVTKETTFKNCAKWMEELRQSAEPDIVIMLVGNKVDLADKDPSSRQVYYDAAQEFATQNGLLFFETSAVTDINVKEGFETLLQEIYDQGTRTSQADNGLQDGLRIGGLPEGEKPVAGCCT
ncbi:RABA2A [Symbiodinium pilosum]|uniref:RABA2A protein n=1 Tax=Symbiodinium pilosum TaxID=2952 RepID=A0A812XPK9_SYMPI|nr:RABA2A [Symbiodinium pilosum]